MISCEFSRQGAETQSPDQKRLLGGFAALREVKKSKNIPNIYLRLLGIRYLEKSWLVVNTLAFERPLKRLLRTLKKPMRKHEEKVFCQTPTPGKQGTRIPKWKYEALRSAILNALPVEGKGLPFKELSARVGQLLPDDIRPKIGSIGWYTTTVKLDLEVRGEVKRVPGTRPQRLLRRI